LLPRLPQKKRGIRSHKERMPSMRVSANKGKRFGLNFPLAAHQVIS
jgi:hypothetical protein